MNIEELPAEPEPGPVPREHRGKPDPSEPWRYVCPQCEGQVHRRPQEYLYRCRRCGEGFEKDDLHDRRQDDLRDNKKDGDLA
jgi:DNA-directed RNA polymerase subunit RPC12/RpoP